MANLTSILTVRMIEAVTAPARAAANSIRGIGNAVDQTNARRLAIGGAVSTMVNDVGKQTKVLQRHMHNMTTGVSMPAGFLAFFGGRAVYDFEKTSNALQAVTDVTDTQRKAIQNYAKELNELFPATNSEIMKGAYELGRAGFKYDQIMGSMKGMLNLALAGDIEIKESADIATNVLTAMRLPMKTVEQANESLLRVNDALAYASSNSNTDVRMMGETFKYVGPMAAAAGMSIEHVAAASMIMAQNGIRASEAGVAMRSALVRMVRPTKPMIAALDRMNVDIRQFVKGGRQISAMDVVSSLASDGIDASGYAKQIEQVLNDPKVNGSLAKLTERLTNIIGGEGSAVDKSALAGTITDVLTAAGSEVDLFGFIKELREKGADLGDIARIFDARQGARLITLLVGDLTKALDDVQKFGVGSTDRMAKTMMKGIVGDWAEMEASLENLFVAIAEAGVLKSASQAFKWAADGLKSLSETNPKLLEFGTYALLIAGALGPIAIVGGGVLSFFLSLVGIMRLAVALGKGTLGVAAAAMGVTAAASAGSAAAGGAAAGGAGAAAAGAAGGAAASTAGKSILGKVVKGAGIVGTAYTIAEVLDAIDPEGNLWGLTSGIDAWVQSKTGINPSKIGAGTPRDGPEATPEEGRAHDISEWQARQSAIDARLNEIAKNMHPSMADMPNMERENLQSEKAILAQQIADAIAVADTQTKTRESAEALANQIIDAVRNAAFNAMPKDDGNVPLPGDKQSVPAFDVPIPTPRPTDQKDERKPKTVTSPAANSDEVPPSVAPPVKQDDVKTLRPPQAADSTKAPSTPGPVQEDLVKPKLPTPARPSDNAREVPAKVSEPHVVTKEAKEPTPPPVQAKEQRNIEPAMPPVNRPEPQVSETRTEKHPSALPNEIEIPVPRPKPAEAGAAAKQTMDGFNASLDTELAAAEQKIDAFMSRIAAKMNTTLRPLVSPRLDMSAISGVHADTGVE